MGSRGVELADTEALSLSVRGIVQGVGFRPFVFRLADTYGLKGWVLNGAEGVKVHLEGDREALDAFIASFEKDPPPAAQIAGVRISPAEVAGYERFEIRRSVGGDRPTVRVSPDLAVCDACLRELFDPQDRRYHYPYINCTDCGPRYSIILGLPYDRPLTTMKRWSLCPSCAAEYRDPTDRRFHAQPVACPHCGPRFVLRERDPFVLRDHEVARDEAAIRRAVSLLETGKVVAVKGLGGFHLACDATNPEAVGALRSRKFRKEKPFALMVRDLETAASLVELSPQEEELLTAVACPIVLAPAREELRSIAPENRDLGLMLPYTPLHHLLFALGAPSALVMTSANRSSEPIAYRDEEASERLAGIADAFLVGQRPIARRLDDSVVRAGAFGPVILRRARGYAPGVVARLPAPGPILAVGADLKNAIALVVDDEVLLSQHIGDLGEYEAFKAFRQTIDDLLSMYEVDAERLRVVHDLHPQYASTKYALSLSARVTQGVQHHRAHIASVLAERGALEKRVLGVAFDGTGYGDDGTIWGGEFFIGSVSEGLERVAHLRPAWLPGGDAAARWPIQAAAGFLAELEGLPELTAPPFRFSSRYLQARELVSKGFRTFATTSVGRLFDAVAALVGFTREVTFEGQAAIWLEHLARKSSCRRSFGIPFVDGELDYRSLLLAVIEARKTGDSPADISRAFHRGLALGICEAVGALCESGGLETVVLSGGVFQNEVLAQDIVRMLEASSVQVWTNREVPPNDGGISLGQAALLVHSAAATASWTSGKPVPRWPRKGSTAAETS